LHQAVTVDAGGWYEFEAWVLHDDRGVASAFLRISWYASPDGSGAAISTDDSTSRLEAPADGYRLLTTDAVQAPADARSARLRIMLAPVSDARAWILADDVGWQRVGTPSPTSTVATPAFGEPPETGQEPRAAAEPRQPRAIGRTTQSQHLAVGPGNAPADSTLVINEIVYDADGDVPDQDAEWVEIYNRSSDAVDLAGWSLSDAASSDVLPTLVVPPHGFAVIAAAPAFHDAYPDVAVPVAVLSGRIGNGLANEGDRLLLADPSGAVVDAVSWGDDAAVLNPSIEGVPSGHSIERRFAGVDSDHAADFIDNEAPSPGGMFGGLVTNPKPQAGAGQSVEILEGSRTGDWDWLAWAIAAASLAAVAGVASWRTAFAVRERLRHG
jgi:hypothetical protein